MKIKVKYHHPACAIQSFGNWIDLKSAENVTMSFGDHKLISLGVSMKLPKYFQANIVPRSSTYSKFKVIQANHIGIVDGPDNLSNGYSGNDDIWKFSAIALDDTTINIGDRICQFEIRPTMFAPWWTKVMWLFSNHITIIEVENLSGKNRGGYGSTG